MKLYGSLTSPFVRAVRIAAIELKLADEIEFVATVVKPTAPNRSFGKDANPLRRVPALETANGEILVDSRVIIEHLNNVGRGTFIPEEPGARVACLNRHAIVAGATEALVSAMYETRLRPAEFQWPDWVDDQIDKAEKALDWAEANLDGFSQSFDLSAAALICLLDYAEFRFAERDWRKGRVKLDGYVSAMSARSSIRETTPPVA